MFDKIKALGTDTAIYGISTILGRFLTFILTPLYAHLLTQSELGIVAIIFGYVAFLNVIYSYGMESAYFKYSATKELGGDRENFTVPFVSLLATSLVFSGILAVCSPGIAHLINVPLESIILYAAAILALDAWAIIPFGSLRMARKSVHFAAIKVAGIVVTVGLNFLFLIHFRMGLEGIFLSNVIGSGLTLVLLLPVIIRNLTPTWNRNLYRALLKFGIPYVPAGLAAMMIQVIDRPILEALTDQATVGIYQANYRIGIAMMLIVSTVDFAWKPFALSHASDPDARPLFARILTYYILLMATVFLVVSFFIGEIVSVPAFWGKSILPAPYWVGLPIVPIVMLAYVFLGVFGNISAGIYIEKKTHLFPIITFAGAGVNVVSNLLLIPVLGFMGAALATLMSYAVMMVMGYFMVRRFFPVPYEFARIAKIVLAAGTVYGLYALIPEGSWFVIVKLALVLFFVALMYAMKFFNTPELKRIMNVMSRRHPADPVSNGNQTPL